MATTLRIADEILHQLGGNKFITMTGSKHFLSDVNTLRMNLIPNQSRANKLEITLDVSDTYTMRFYRYTPGKLNRKTYTWTDDKVTEVETIEGLYAEDLQQVFTQVTGLDTHL